MRNTWTIEDKAWRADGIRQDQVLSIWKVPKVVQAALHPTNISSLSSGLGISEHTQ